MMNPTFKGYLLGAIAAASYGMNPLFTLPLYADGMTADAVLFYRYLFAVVAVGIMLAVRRGRDFRVPLGKVPAIVVLGVMMALSSVTLFLSYHYMAAGVASTLLFVYPIVTAVLMAVVFHERDGWTVVLAIALAVGGIALLYRGGDGATLSTLGTLLVFGSALSYAVYLVGVNHAGLNAMPTLRITFWVLVVGLVGFTLSVWAQGAWQVPSRWYLWLCLLGLGLLPTAVSLLCTTAAIPLIGSTATAILGALEPVTAVIIGTLVFAEPLTFRLSMGIVLIIAAVTLVVAGGTVAHKLNRIRRMFPRRRRT